MKIAKYQKHIILILHLIFWFVSFNFWYLVLNPGVESAGVIQDFEVEMNLILILNTVLLIYCSLPFIWLAKSLRTWIKTIPTVIFLIPVGYFVLQALKPEGITDDVKAFLEYFVKNFLYVVVFHLSIVAAVYFNLKVLMVKFLSKSRFLRYLLWIIALVFGTAILNYAIYNYLIDKLLPQLYYISYFKIWELVLIVKAYLVLSILVFLLVQYFESLIAKREAARNELQALKAQINPHFLFNNLNTIYSLASKKDERTADIVLQLSDFLRYVLYDTASETIPLEKEIDIIKAYIGLQKERLNPELIRVEFKTEGHFAEAQISPLLLLPLAENCFKHGIGKDFGTIAIEIIFDGNQLMFKTENRVISGETENGGIGLTNVEKRLNLIYPERHSLQYKMEDGLFRLEMKIKLI